MIDAGGSEASLLQPILAMKTTALSLDSVNTSSINAAAESAMASVTSSVSSSLPGLSNSLFDIQNTTKESISSAVSDFGSSMLGINPAIANQVTDVGLGSLTDAGRFTDSLCSTGFNTATSAVTDAVSNVSNAVAAKAAASISSVTSTIKDLPSASSLFSSTSSKVPAASSLSPGEILISDPDEDPVPNGENTTDIIYQEVKIYVEGVQVPFESASINQSIGQLPSASFQIPPQAGLMDIARYYQPKVHIFYTDKNTGGDRLLFWGHIIAVNYAYSQEHSSATVAFECIHKNALMQQLTFEWSAGGSYHATSGSNFTNNNPDQATIQMHNFNSEQSMILALQGITELQKDGKDALTPGNADVGKADVTKLDTRFKDFEKRLVGMPASIMNIWNQVKREIYGNQKLNIIFTKMYMPLVEDGLAFFDRMSGHYFVENQIQSSKQDHCKDHGRPEMSKHKTMLPPSFRMDAASAIQTQMVVKSLSSALGFSGELMNFFDLFMNFYYSIEYDMLTLASPAEVPVNPTSTADLDDPVTWKAQTRMAIETIIKPQIPFYYSPICNVILPNMFTTINVTQSEADIPTRITAVSTAASEATGAAGSLGVNYRAPHSIREVVALGRQLVDSSNTNTDAGTLRDTTGSSYNLPGKYELGRGINHKKMFMPSWLTHFTAANDSKRSAKDDELFPIAGTVEAKNLNDLHQAWIDRYGFYPGEEGRRIRDKSRDVLDPYSKKSNIMSYERLLFAAADYDYTKEVVKSKTGGVQCIFNPYIIPGYPMDIIAKSPNHPSFHAMCASVTHSISSRGIGTSVSFMAAITYTEMSNYFLQPIHPWLQTALKMVNVARDEDIADGSSVSEDDKETTLPADKIVSAPTPATSADKAKKMISKESIQKTTDVALSDALSSKYGLTPEPVYDTNKGDINNVNQSLIGNTRAQLVADQFYKGVLGVGAAEPALIFDFQIGTASPIERKNGIWGKGSAESKHLSKGNYGEQNDNLTAVGGLRLVSRQIESKRSIETKFGIKFIDLSPANYNGAPAIYANEVLTNSTLLEPGCSPFLDYVEIGEFISSTTIGDAI